MAYYTTNLIIVDHEKCTRFSDSIDHDSPQDALKYMDDIRLIYSHERYDLRYFIRTTDGKDHAVYYICYTKKGGLKDGRNKDVAG